MFSPLMFETIAFIVGLLFGSFLNVCISRLPRHKSIRTPRSYCASCLATIRWYDNIPLLSFVLLRGKCRNCKAKIPWRYSLVELGVGLWLWLCANLFSSFVAISKLGSFLWSGTVQGFETFFVLGGARFILEYTTLAILGFLLIGLLVMDWQTHTLPDAFTLTGMTIGFALTCVQALLLAPGAGDIHLHRSVRMSSPGSMAAQGDVFLTGPEALVLGRIGAIVAVACLVLLIRWLYKKVRGQEGMGLGDAKIMAMIAAFLGFWPAILALFVGVILCAAYAVALVARRHANGQTRLPLGTFLSIGGLLAALFGVPLIEWYRSLL